MKTIDFTKSFWGHSLHAETFRQKKAHTNLKRIMDKRKNRRRYSVMCHSKYYPEIGDKIKYKSARGEVFASIYEVEPCGDPKDMFTLFIVVND